MRVFLSISFLSRKGLQDVLYRALDNALRRNGQTLELIFPYDGAPPCDQETLKQHLQEADLLIADLSDRNPAALWEIGFAQALGKPVLLLAQDTADIAPDLRDQPVILYSPNIHVGHLISRVAESVDQLISSRSSGNHRTKKRPPRTVFISYSHADSDYLHRILVHLKPLERARLIDAWSDKKIAAGQKWQKEIENALQSARVAVLLISADFLASEFVAGNELPPLLAAAERKGTRIIPIILKPCRFCRDESLARFQALNDPKDPVITMSEFHRESLYEHLAEIVELDLQKS